jgi:hypothetical protein
VREEYEQRPLCEHPKRTTIAVWADQLSIGSVPALLVGSAPIASR